MSIHTRKSRADDLIELTYQGDSTIKFMVPHSVLAQLKPYRIFIDGHESIPADIVFKKSYDKYGKIGATLRGARARDDMTQAQLAKKLAIAVQQVRQMEYSKIEIDKNMAQKLAKIFNTHYNLFLKKS